MKIALFLSAPYIVHSGSEDIGIGKTEFVDTLFDIAYTEYVAFRALELFDNLILKSSVVLILIDVDLTEKIPEISGYFRIRKKRQRDLLLIRKNRTGWGK